VVSQYLAKISLGTRCATTLKGFDPQSCSSLNHADHYTIEKQSAKIPTGNTEYENFAGMS
jgi:hypothetical protein